MLRKITRRVWTRTSIGAKRPIEALEHRTLLSSVVVNSTSDTATGTGVVTLRDAITTANSSDTPTTITFDSTVFATAQTIVLDGTQLELSNTTEPTTITGPNASVTLSGNAASRDFLVDSGVSLSMSGLTVTDGKATDTEGAGGGILVAGGGTLSLNDVTVSNNTGITGGSGAGLANLGTATLTNDTFTGNVAITFTNSTQVPDGQGGAIYNYGTMTVNGSLITGNTAGRGGAGIFNAGTITVTDTTISSNTAGSGGFGAGFDSNPAYISSGAVATLTDDTVSGNTDPSCEDAVASFGGGGTAPTTLIMTNVTVADNTGGGVYLDAANVDSKLIGVTIQGNTGATNCPGIYDTAGSGATIGNSIVAGNVATGSGVVGTDAYGAVDSLGNNLIGATDGSTGWISGDLTGTAASPLNANLGSLANNGGTTETLLPLATSPAIGSGSIAIIPAGITTDQRGDPRTLDGAVDIGAVEAGGPVVAKAASVTTIAALAHTQVVGQADTFTVSVTSASGSGAVPTGTVTIYQNGNIQGTYALINGQVSETYTVLTQSPNTVYSAVYSGDAGYTGSGSNGVAEVYLPASAATARITKAVVPPAAIAGQKFNSRIPVVLTNTGATLTGLFSAVVYADAPATGLDTAPLQVGSLARRTTLKTGRAFTLMLSTRKLPPSLPAGIYHLVVEVTDPAANYDLVTTAQTVTVAAPFISLAATLSPIRPGIIKPGKFGSTVVTLTNSGNITAAGPATFTLSPSADGITALPTTLVSVSRRLSIKPGKSARVVLRFSPELAAGTYLPLLNILFAGVTSTATGSSFPVG